MAEKLDRLKEKRDALNAQIQRETAREQQRARKERDARMMVWGIALDAALKSGEISRDDVVHLLDEHLTRATDRQRAFTGPLEREDPKSDDDQDRPEDPGSTDHDT